MGSEHQPDEPRRLTDAESRAAARARIQQQETWVDLQVRQAIERGEFDHLPGAGKPIEGLGGDPDPDWWLRKLVERERIVVLPASIQLRKDDAALDGLLDRENSEGRARALVEEFNERVLKARYSLPEGPPLVTMPRDVEETLARWRERREARIEEQRRQRAQETSARRRRWRRRS